MAKMATTAIAGDFNTGHAEARIIREMNGVWIKSLKECRPTTAGVVFATRAEQGLSASAALIHPLIELMIELTRESPLGPLFAQDMILLGREDFLPFFFGFWDLVVGEMGHMGIAYHVPTLPCPSSQLSCVLSI